MKNEFGIRVIYNQFSNKWNVVSDLCENFGAFAEKEQAEAFKAALEFYSNDEEDI